MPQVFYRTSRDYDPVIGRRRLYRVQNGDIQYRMEGWDEHRWRRSQLYDNNMYAFMDAIHEGRMVPYLRPGVSNAATIQAE